MFTFQTSFTFMCLWYCNWKITFLLNIILKVSISHQDCWATYWCFNFYVVKGITHWGFFIYIKLGILSLCTEPWHGTRSMSISWDCCLYWTAIWWIDYVYIYWLWIHTHLSTTYNLNLNCSLILTHARRSEQGLTTWIAVTVIISWQSLTRLHHWVMSLTFKMHIDKHNFNHILIYLGKVAIPTLIWSVKYCFAYL